MPRTLVHFLHRMVYGNKKNPLDSTDWDRKILIGRFVFVLPVRMLMRTGDMEEKCCCCCCLFVVVSCVCARIVECIEKWIINHQMLWRWVLPLVLRWWSWEILSY